MVLFDDSSVKKWDNRQTAAEHECSSLGEEQKQLENFAPD